MKRKPLARVDRKVDQADKFAGPFRFQRAGLAGSITCTIVEWSEETMK